MRADRSFGTDSTRLEGHRISSTLAPHWARLSVCYKAPRPGKGCLFQAPSYSKLFRASFSVSYTSKTSESLVTTKMFWIFLSTAASFIFAPRLA